MKQVAHRNIMGSLELLDAFDESSLDLGDIFEESRPDCALVKRELKVKELSNEQLDVSREDSIQSPHNTTSNEANVTSSIKKEKLQSELVRCIERMPIVKAEIDINVGKSNDYSSDGNPKDRYLIEECQNEVYFSLTRHVRTEPLMADSEEEESLNTFEKSICNERTIKEEYFIESEIIVQQELDIKDEDEGEDQFTAKSAVSQVKKKHHRSNRTVLLNRISTNQTKRRSNYEAHEFRHENRNKWFSCTLCSYKTTRKYHLKRHMLVHKSGSEIQWFRCSECPFKTKRSTTLKQHVLVHKSGSEIQWFRCSECSFKAKRSTDLKQHMLVHKSSSEIQWFRCSECPFKTKRSNTLRQHMLVHKSGSEIQWFRCSECPFKTKRSNTLRKHMLVHKSGNEIQWFRCSQCPFKTKYSSALKKHMLVHKSSSEIQWCRCSECPFKTKRSNALKRHKLIHTLKLVNKKPEMISEFFYCYLCTLRTPRKDSLARHIQRRHRDTILDE